jgi:subtilisin family serine protease
MKQLLFTMLFIALQLGLIAQSLSNYPNYYYYENQTVPLQFEGKRLLVKFDANVSATQQVSILEGLNLNVQSVENLPAPVVTIVYLNSPINQADLDNTLSQLAAHNMIDYASPFFSYKGVFQTVTREFIVKLNNLSDYNSLVQMANTKGAIIKDENPFVAGMYTLEATGTHNAMELSNVFHKSGAFEYAEPNFIAFLQKMTTDPLYSTQWSIQNLGTSTIANGVSDADMDVSLAWLYTTGSPTIKVAVLDEGVDLNHPDLVGNMLSGYDGTGLGSGGAPSGNDAHGTACAGIIAATANNNLGGAGVAYNCKIIPVRIAYSNAAGNWVTTNTGTTNSINWAWQTANADILSNSWGGGSPTTSKTNAINSAVSSGRNGLGCPVLFAAGNSDGAVIHPADLSSVIAVGAMSMCNERKNPSSCDGESWWGSCYGTQLDVVAPGVKIVATDISGAAGYNSGDYTSTFNGTSSATPNTAGVMALILSQNVGLTEAEARDILESTCDKAGSYTYASTAGHPNGTWNNEMGYGRVNAYLAVIAANNACTKTAPYTESFNGTTTPACWTQSATTGGPWVFPGNPDYGVNLATDHTGNGGNFATMDFSGTDAGVIMQVRDVNISALTTPTLSFYLYSYNNNNTVRNPLYVEAYNGSSWVTIGTIQSSINAWTKYDYILSSYTFTSKVRVRFRAERDPAAASGWFYNDLLIDDVSIDEYCAPVTSLAVSRTASHANVTWASTGGTYRLEYGPSGFAPGTGTLALGVSSGYTITGLANNTVYDVYVQKDCGSTESVLAKTTFFTCSPNVAPYTQSFNGTVTPTCWLQSAASGGPWEFPGNPDYGVNLVTDHTGNGGNFATMDFSYFIGAEDDDVVLQMNDVNVAALSTPAVSFYLYSYNNNDAVQNQLKVQAYNGVSWVTLATIQSSFDYWRLYSYNLSAYVSSNIVKVRFVADRDAAAISNWYYNDLLIDDVTIDEYCAPVTSLNAPYATASSGQINWTSNVGLYELEYGLTGFAPGTGTTITNITEEQHTLTGLVSNTTYDVYVRANCGGALKSPIQMVSFTTCSPDVAPYVQSFDAAATPSCWLQTAHSGGPWQFPGFPGYNLSGLPEHTGNGGYYATMDFSTPADTGVVMQMNDIDVSALTNPTLSFYLYSYNNYSVDSNQLFVEVNYNNYWYQLGYIQQDENGWILHTYNLAGWAMGGVVKVRFRAERGLNNTGTFYYNDFVIDDIRVDELCTPVADLAVTPVTSASTSTTLSWTSAAGLYNIQYGPEGFAPGTGTQITGHTANSWNFTGLVPGNSYEFYVQTDCGSGNLSSWQGPVGVYVPMEGMIVLGTTYSVSNSAAPSPVNIWYRSLRYQTLYTAAELTAAGASAGYINSLGWWVTGAPIYDLPNYTVRMKNTTATDNAVHDGSGLTQVYTTTSYAPNAGGFDMLPFQTPFLWDGVSNILVDICFDQVNPTYDASGQTRMTNAIAGARYVRADGSSQCGNTTTAIQNQKPQVKFAFNQDTCEVSWIDFNNVSYNTNTITKTGGTSTNWNASARGTGILQAGKDGWAAMQILETDKFRIFGLAHTNTTVTFADIDYAVYLRNNGNAQVYESGVLVASLGAYATGDKFKIQRNGTTVYYYKNDVLFYISTVPSTTDLMVDIAIKSINGTIYNTQASFGCFDCLQPLITLNTKTDESCLGFNDGSISITPALSGVTYQWLDNPSQVTNTRTNLAGGIYTVIANGISPLCADTLDVTILPGVDCATPACPITWVGMNGTAVSGTTLSKTSTSTAWDGNAYSQGTLLSGLNGWASMTVLETNTFRTFGLAMPNTTLDESNINYGIRLRNNATVQIVENGSLVATVGVYANGDVFRIQRVGTTIKYLRNGVVIYTSAVASSTNLIVDVSIRSTGGTIYNVQTDFSCDPIELCPIAWTNMVNTNLTGTTISKTNISTLWDAAATSTGTLLSGKDGWATMEILETNTFRMFGLAQPNTTANETNINYGILLRSNGVVQISESGIIIGNFGNYITGDVFSVQRVGSNVRYFRNGLLLYSSTTPSTTNLVADMSIKTTGGTIYNVKTSFSCDPIVLCPIVWTGFSNTALSGATITKTGAGLNWDGGAYSSATLPAGEDGWATTQILETNTFRMFGLASPNVSNDDLTINYGIKFRSNATIQIVENGTTIGSFGNYANGDVFSVQRTGTTIRYFQNGVWLYTSTVASTTDLIADISIRNPNATIYDVKTSFSCIEECPIVWEGLNNTTLTGTTLTKTNASTSWDGAANSTSILPSGNNGYAAMEVLETNTFRVFGLAQVNTNFDVLDIDYAIRLRNNGLIQILENGTLIGTNYGTYNTGDIMKIERIGTTINYLRNGTVFYTSIVPSTTALMVDVSIKDNGGTIHNVVTDFSCTSARIANTPNTYKNNSIPTITFDDVMVYPNPFREQVTIDYAVNVEDVKTIELYHINGQHVRSIEVNANGQTIIDTSDLNSGLYIISINGTKHFKVVKM